MSHYKSNLRDIEFNLFEMLDIEDYVGTVPFEDFDRQTVDDALREVERLAREEWGSSFVDSDRNPPALIDGDVLLSDEIKASLAAYYEGGWERLGMPKSVGGFGAPATVRWATQELFAGANGGIFLYVTGAMMATIIAAVGTAGQREKWAIPMIERQWGGTMVLTEPDAGSDVGAGTTKAIAIDESAGVYHLEGVKRFITAGDQDFSENIVHLVLARREGGEPGTKGLSMFIVPKYHVNDDGSIGERNGVTVRNLEKKMGLKGSATCELAFGEDEPAVGYLVGGVHEGIRQMFLIIEDARLLIGTKSMATLSTGYLNALEYATERVQSADMTQMLDKTAPRVEIIRHPDVRRMLMLQKAYTEGMRALVYYTAWSLDQATVYPDEGWKQLTDLLLPLVKGYNSEKAYELLAQSLQVFGGSGFLMDYPIEQYVRDVKIDSLYEGTTGIQSLDLFFRKIVRDRGETLGGLAERVLAEVKGGADELAVERQLLGEALDHARAHIGVLSGHVEGAMSHPPEVYKAGLHTNALLESLAEIVIGWLLLRQAEVALAALEGDPGSDRAFYEGKVAAARFFAADALPKARLRRERAEAEDGSLMELADGAF